MGDSAEDTLSLYLSILLGSCRSSERGKDHILQRKHYMLLGSESGVSFTDTENKPMVTKGEREGQG